MYKIIASFVTVLMKFLGTYKSVSFVRFEVLIVVVMKSSVFSDSNTV
jgi:hypothetical protein